MRESSPSPNQDLREYLELLYQRRIALDRVIRSLEDYRQSCTKIPVGVPGETRMSANSFERLAS